MSYTPYFSSPFLLFLFSFFSQVFLLFFPFILFLHFILIYFHILFHSFPFFRLQFISSTLLSLLFLHPVHPSFPLTLSFTLLLSFFHAFCFPFYLHCKLPCQNLLPIQLLISLIIHSHWLMKIANATF